MKLLKIFTIYQIFGALLNLCNARFFFLSFEWGIGRKVSSSSFLFGTILVEFHIASTSFEVTLHHFAKWVYPWQTKFLDKPSPNEGP